MRFTPALMLASLVLQGCGRGFPCGRPSEFIRHPNDVDPVIACDAMAGRDFNEAKEFALRFDVLATASHSNLILVQRRAPWGALNVPWRDEMILTAPSGGVRSRFHHWQMHHPVSGVSSYSLSPEGLLLATGTRATKTDRFFGLLLLDLPKRTWVPIRQLPDDVYGTSVAGWLDEDQVIFDDGRSVFVKSISGVGERKVASGRVVSVAPNRQLVAVAVDNSVKLLSPRDFQERCSGLPPLRALPGAVWSPDSRFVWISGDNRSTALVPNIAKLIDVERCRTADRRLVLAGSGVTRWRWLNMDFVAALKAAVP